MWYEHTATYVLDAQNCQKQTAVTQNTYTLDENYQLALLSSHC